MSSVWRVMFLAEKYGRMTLALDEAAEQIGLAPSSQQLSLSLPAQHQAAQHPPTASAPLQDLLAGASPILGVDALACGLSAG